MRTFGKTDAQKMAAETHTAKHEANLAIERAQRAERENAELRESLGRLQTEFNAGRATATAIILDDPWRMAEANLDNALAEVDKLGERLTVEKRAASQREHTLRVMLAAGDMLCEEPELLALGIDPHATCPHCNTIH